MAVSNITQTTSSGGRYCPEELPELRGKDRHLPLGDEPYNGAVVVVGKVQLRGDQAPREYVARIYDEAYYPVSLEAEVWRAVRYPDDGVAPDCATRTDFDYAAEAAAYQLIRKSPQLGPAELRLGSMAHGPLLNLDQRGINGSKWSSDAKPMSKLLREAKQHKAGLPLLPEFDRLNTLKSLTDANEELWWWCEINCYELRPYDVLVCKDGTAKIIKLNRAILHSFIGDMKFLRHPHTVHPDISEDELKAMGEHTSPVWRYWPFEADSYGVPLWKLVEAEHPEDTETGPWEEWVPESWLENPEETGIWLLGTYQNDSRFSPLDESFLGNEHHKELASQLLQLLEQLGRKSEVELEALRLAGELDSKCVSLNTY
ncbi:hypothetical protein QC761_206485 [Podospora bellae-mahoneyi]|uniref:Uncharacterized protein n=1 Tax=Podospora bellae-mahoneyi TaxID=2093777 RepID=A0ABR0FSH6_9PEZI|nr:hypothetical protein QC761_206485 [Podospora bellae-mahoneyi]